MRGELVIDPKAPTFHQGMELYAMGEYGEALRVFLEEARSREGEIPQRAGIAYRQAALCARHLGRMDEFDHYMRLAGREFLRASELPDQPAQHIREYSLLAAQCFLAVENLDLSSKSVSRAKTVDVALQEPVAEAFAVEATAPRDEFLEAQRKDAQGPPEKRQAMEAPSGGPDAESGELDAALRAVEARWLGGESAVPSGPRAAHESGSHRTERERARTEAAWAADVLHELDEMHALVVDLQKRIQGLERRLQLAMRQSETEGTR
ncbi:hypothetical protein [Alicyclobacillus fructus]|uniref:hypothetical protein n=1 Tax=Alicyclobacillus fructus TaxID=2816082 RepID=UPI002E2A13C4|nr:hypothetical protein [Alicyclobacillus fructus]